MLRRADESPGQPVTPPAETSSFPSTDQPFTAEDRPPGIRFYQGRTSFFHPYALLQRMSYKADSLKIVFADAEVLVEGTGLHALYLRLAEQRVACIVEQSRRVPPDCQPSTHISRIKGTPRTRKKQQPSQEPEEPFELEPQE